MGSAIIIDMPSCLLVAVDDLDNILEIKALHRGLRMTSPEKFCDVVPSWAIFMQSEYRKYAFTPIICKANAYFAF